MSPYKVFRYVLRVLLSLSVLLTILAVIMPIYQYQTKAASDTDVQLFDGSKSESAGRQWILDYKKATRLSQNKPDVLIVTSGSDFESRIMDYVDHNVLVLEMLFNQFDMPSRNNDRLSTIADVQYSGFIGKTFSDLGRVDLIPEEWTSNFERLYSKEWNFSGEGMVFFSAEAVIVLKKGKDYESELKLKDGTFNMPYHGYFEVTTSQQTPLAVLDLDVTAEGKSRLEAHGIGSSFPALYKSVQPLFTAYYIALNVGDQFVDLPHRYENMPFLMSHKVIYNQKLDEKVFWKWYYPKLSGILASRHSYTWSLSENSDFGKFGVEGTQIVHTDKKGLKKPFFIKGINLGAALPAKAFTEFPREKSTYTQWLQQMKTLNINSVRVYTLLPPEFYEALYDINQEQEEPIYLLQEIWPEEHPTDSNYLDESYNQTYQNEIKWTVSALHGDVTIPTRPYRAYGMYQFDVSEYVLGYLVGRELEPDEVKETDRLNRGYYFKGDYIYSEAMATPTEAWLASACDYVLQVDNEKYGDKPLVAIVSWPTLDPLTHDSEWNSSGDKSLQYNDSQTVDISHIGIDKSKVSGFFGAYHIYPNYPDFMNLDPSYASYHDDEGEFRYGGYLKAFIEQHTLYPAVVAEYGISTSMYTAHFSPNGLNHGGLSEMDQGEAVIRMTKAIMDEGYSGAIVFEWMDEWTKKTWITEPFMIPYNRHALWHNVMDPEQGYGLLSYDPSNPSYENVTDDLSTVSNLESVQVAQNEAFIFLKFKFKEIKDMEQPFQLAVSTFSERQGEDLWEFLITVDKTSEIRVNPGYNWTRGRFKAVDEPFEKYEKMSLITNAENMTKEGLLTPSASLDLSLLNRGAFNVSQNHIEVEGEYMTLRIPYGLIGISDPSSGQVLSDDKTGIPTSQDSIRTKVSRAIQYKLFSDGKSIDFEQKLIGWEMPIYTPRLKSGVKLLSDYFKTLP